MLIAPLGYLAGRPLSVSHGTVYPVSILRLVHSILFYESLPTYKAAKLGEKKLTGGSLTLFKLNVVPSMLSREAFLHLPHASIPEFRASKGNLHHSPPRHRAPVTRRVSARR